MADQITKILIRSGTTDEKNTIILDAAELGYATDSKKVWLLFFLDFYNFANLQITKNNNKKSNLMFSSTCFIFFEELS